MTKEQLEELRGLVAKATPCEWLCEERVWNEDIHVDIVANVEHDHADWIFSCPVSPRRLGKSVDEIQSNAASVAALRNNAEFLIDSALELGSLRIEVDSAHAKIAWLESIICSMRDAEDVSAERKK